MNPRLLMTMLTFGAALADAVRMQRREDGAAVFKAQCAKCHGETRATPTRRPRKTLKVPKLKGDAKVAGMSNDAIVALGEGATRSTRASSRSSPTSRSARRPAYAKQLAGGK